MRVDHALKVFVVFEHEVDFALLYLFIFFNVENNGHVVVVFICL